MRLVSERGGYLVMHRFALMMAAFATIACLGWSDPAEARHLRSRAGAHGVWGSCRVPPWYRGLEGLAPWVCADYWWSPRFYYQGMGVQYRRRHY
jgi:hypothetical protein